MTDAMWKVCRVPWLQEPNDQGPMGCDEDVCIWEGVSCSINSLEYGDVWQQSAGIPFPQGLFATNAVSVQSYGALCKFGI